MDALARTVATGSPMAREHAHHALLRLAEPLTTSTPQSLPGAPPPPKGGWGTWLGIGRKPANDPQQAVAAEVNYLVELASTGGSGAEEAVTALIELFRELYEHREGDEGELEGDQEDEDEAERGGERAAPAAPPPAAESAAAAGAAAEAVPSKRDQSAPPASGGQRSTWGSWASSWIFCAETRPLEPSAPLFERIVTVPPRRKDEPINLNVL